MRDLTTLPNNTNSGIGSSETFAQLYTPHAIAEQIRAR